jgi:diaminohydroxyphosphoribosylaminopyrimidine deaminase/5-amino-6-(5-phosphoribosylamino)uracil reductase
MSRLVSTETDRLFLLAAVELARRGMNSTTPNPRVGCLIVHEGAVVGRGWHVRAGESHAEVNALADAAAHAGRNAARDATAYVSLEPCCFEGRTPPCSRTLIDAGVARVVVAMVDPHPRVAGAGIAELERAGIAVDTMDLPEAHALLEGYVSRVTTGRPFVRIKMAASLDGRTAMASGESQWITGEVARADVQRWRARSCAIITGSGTVLADDPALTVRDASLAVDGNIRQPLRVIVDSRARIGATAQIFQPPGEVLVAHVKGRPRTDEAEYLMLSGGADGHVDLAGLLDELGARHCNEVLVEAGPTLAGAFLATGFWDELLVYLAPKLLGSAARPFAELPIARMADAIGATIVDRAAVGEDVRLRLRP